MSKHHDQKGNLSTKRIKALKAVRRRQHRVSDQGTLNVSDPAVPIWTLEVLPDHVEKIWQNRSLSQEEVQKAVEVLNKAVEEASKRD
jgi:hypothetical protein